MELVWIVKTRILKLPFAISFLSNMRYYVTTKSQRWIFKETEFVLSSVRSTILQFHPIVSDKKCSWSAKVRPMKKRQHSSNKFYLNSTTSKVRILNGKYDDQEIAESEFSSYNQISAKLTSNEFLKNATVIYP